jgi:Zinc carboxypeptidase
MAHRRALAITPLLLAGVCIASTPPAGARTVTIGHSVRRRPITAQVLGADSAPRKVLLVGCIHGNECAGVKILNAISRKPVPAGVQLWLVREMNPDGAAFDTRQNADGVDLNRNFPFRWRAISDPTYDSGPRPGCALPACRFYRVPPPTGPTTDSRGPPRSSSSSLQVRSPRRRSRATSGPSAEPSWGTAPGRAPAVVDEILMP